MPVFQTATETPKLYLVTGAHGFIGSHVARRLFQQAGVRVRIVDITARTSFPERICHEFIQGDIRLLSVCEYAVRDVHTVIHFAANMGGMGTIHHDNDFILYRDNHLMTTNMLNASLAAGVKCFAYASSACVYPEECQGKTNAGNVSLKESDVWIHTPPQPQGLYGLEKLNSELLIHQFASNMDMKLARFHNVYGPGGSWNDGREKAPAALLRKALALKYLKDSYAANFEIWGDGNQQRSFLYIDDAVDGFLRLLESDKAGPFNIGSDIPVTIQDLVEIALDCAGVSHDRISFTYDTSKPIGVACRNSNNDYIKSNLDWCPRVSLADGMKRTGAWMEERIKSSIQSLPSHRQQSMLLEFQTSKLVHLQPSKIKFGILLPITSGGNTTSSDNCLKNLREFATSLIRTTARDCDPLLDGGDVVFRYVVYLAIDTDDDFLQYLDEEGNNRAEKVLREAGVFNIVKINCDYPRGHVCKIWQDCARKAWTDGCDYMVLMGDDVTLEDAGWLKAVHEEFNEISRQNKTPLGFGCVAFTDTSFPGMPTFPVIHRTHMDIFNGDVVPDAFINQDGDPYLFQLYRRWGCSKMIASRLSNGIGGEGNARYRKQSAVNWTFTTLDDGVRTAKSYLGDLGERLRKVTLDIIIPCYRVDMPILERILGLQSSPTCSVMFIIIVDNPSSPHTYELQQKYGQRVDVRIRVNKTNLGASGSRNRGLEESAADWVFFLDDDIVPQDDILKKAEDSIRSHPDAAGFVGCSSFPVADTIFKAAVHLAGVTYFWDIASKLEGQAARDVPWGVTANLIARRNLEQADRQVRFDTSFPKTGGGEDIHFCRMKRHLSVEQGLEAFYAAPEVLVTHPWWNGGRRSYWRFYNWSVGDGALIKLFPEHVYLDFALNSAESMLICSLGAAVSIGLAQFDLFLFFCKTFAAVVIANILHDCYRHLYRHPERNSSMKTSLHRNSLRWCIAVIESSFIRMFSEIGRLRGILDRKEYFLIGRRFDWFAGTNINAIKEERSNSLERITLVVFLFLFLF
ncbi:NAD-dependent epimerase/dehydratase [Agrocybe pediades]|nr:NAD-dependent epimerase/dehydratase [Agrocybe pediades]